MSVVTRGDEADGGNITDWSLSQLVGRYRRCMVRIESPGNDRIDYGSAFHIGDGWLVTASHVVRDRDFKAVPEENVRYNSDAPLTVKRMIVTGPPNDLALIETDFDLSFYMNRTTIVGAPGGWKVDHIPIGGHLDDWLDESLVMSRYVVMGYPQVPGSPGRLLMADGGYVNAIVDPEMREHPYFIVSNLPREGFSGGPIISEYDFLLGVVTDAFPASEESLGLHMTAAISVEPLWGLLIDNNILPASNAEFIRELLDPTVPSPGAASLDPSGTG